MQLYVALNKFRKVVEVEGINIKSNRLFISHEGKTYYKSLEKSKVFLAENESGPFYEVTHMQHWFPNQKLLARIKRNPFLYDVEAIDFSNKEVQLRHNDYVFKQPFKKISLFIKPAKVLPVYKAEDFYTTETIMPKKISEIFGIPLLTSSK